MGAMPDKYYDVVVVGRSLGALATAAMLARRDFTVLVVGNARPGANYHFEDYTLRRRAFTLLAGATPVLRRVMGELAHSQAWRRRVQPVEPMLQCLVPGRRFEVPPDAELFSREVDREFPEMRRPIADFYDDLARVTAAADSAFGRDALWPPGTFFERRETGRIASTLPYARAEPHADLLAEFPRGHIYRRIVNETVRFATDLSSMPPAFAVARLHGAWTRGLLWLPGGEQEFDDVLLARIESNGGDVRLRDRIAAVDVRRGAVSGVQLDGEARAVGTGFVITDMSGEELAALSGGRGISKRAQREWPRVNAPIGRYVVSLVVRRGGLPASLGGEAFLLPKGEGRTLHVQRIPLPDGADLLVVELLVSARDKTPIGDLRKLILKRLCLELPFFERHIELIDSVHDGLPLWRYTGESRDPFRPDMMVQRSALDGAASRAEPMERQVDVDPPGYLGLAGESIRGPIERTLLVGSTVLPALGQEGRLLAACAAARIVTKTDRRKARMRREMWTKIEIS